ncbi:hypothetical protein [Nocardia salmonicida]
MSYLSLTSTRSGIEDVRYVPAHTANAGVGEPFEMAAYVRVGLSGDASMILDIEDVRELAQRLPDMLMSHDAAEHAAKEHAAAESKAA